VGRGKDVDDVARAPVLLQIAQQILVMLDFVGRRSFGQSHDGRHEKRKEKNRSNNGMKEIGPGAYTFSSCSNCE